MSYLEEASAVLKVFEDRYNKLAPKGAVARSAASVKSGSTGGDFHTSETHEILLPLRLEYFFKKALVDPALAPHHPSITANLLTVENVESDVNTSDDTNYLLSISVKQAQKEGVVSHSIKQYYSETKSLISEVKVLKSTTARLEGSYCNPTKAVSNAERLTNEKSNFDSQRNYYDEQIANPSKGKALIPSRSYHNSANSSLCINEDSVNFYSLLDRDLYSISTDSEEATTRKLAQKQAAVKDSGKSHPTIYVDKTSHKLCSDNFIQESIPSFPAPSRSSSEGVFIKQAPGILSRQCHNSLSSQIDLFEKSSPHPFTLDHLHIAKFAFEDLAFSPPNTSEFHSKTMAKGKKDSPLSRTNSKNDDFRYVPPHRRNVRSGTSTTTMAATHETNPTAPPQDMSVGQTEVKHAKHDVKLNSQVAKAEKSVAPLDQQNSDSQLSQVVTGTNNVQPLGKGVQHWLPPHLRAPKSKAKMIEKTSKKLNDSGSLEPKNHATSPSVMDKQEQTVARDVSDGNLGSWDHNFSNGTASTGTDPHLVGNFLPCSGSSATNISSDEKVESMAKVRPAFSKNAYDGRTPSSKAPLNLKSSNATFSKIERDSSWTSDSRAWGSESRKQMMESAAKSAAQQDFAPKKFTKMIDNPNLQHRIDNASKLPTVNEQFEALMHPYLRNIPPIKFRGKELREAKAKKEAEDQINKVSGWEKTPETNLSPSPYGQKKLQKVEPSSPAEPLEHSRFKNVTPNDHTIHRIKPAARHSPNTSKLITSDGNVPPPSSNSYKYGKYGRTITVFEPSRAPGTLARQATQSPANKQNTNLPSTQESTPIGQMPNQLTSNKVGKLPGNESGAGPAVSSAGSLAGHGARSHARLKGSENKTAKQRFEPFDFDQLPEYNKRAVALLSGTALGIEVDIDNYNKESHGGEPSQVADNDSLIADNLSVGGVERALKKPTQNEIYIWRWFTKAEESLDTMSDSEMPADQVEAQLCNWDGNFEIPDHVTVTNAIYSIGPNKVMAIENWLKGICFTAEHRPFSVDTSTEAFKSGRQMVSGMRREYPQMPPWSIIPDVRPHFGPIDWHKVPTLPPIDDFSNHPVRRKLTARLCCKIARQQHAMNMEEDRKQQADMLRENRRIALEMRGKEREAFHPPLKQKIENNPWVPKANIYIRPARLQDMVKACEIYNHYVSNSVDVPDTAPKTPEYFENIFNYCEEDRVPFMVAILKNSGRREKPVRGNPRRQISDSSENVVGITWIESMGARDSALHQMANVRIYVHPGHLRQGIGKTLFDRLMPAVDRHYQSHYGTDLDIDRLEFNNYHGGGMTPKNKMCFDLYWETADKTEFKWKKAWLEKQGYSICSFFNNAAVKFGRPVNIVTMLREAMSGPANISMIWPGEQANFPNIILGL